MDPLVGPGRESHDDQPIAWWRHADGNSYRVRKWVEGRRVQRRFRTLDEALTFLRDLEGRITVSRLREIHETGSTRVGDLVGRWFADHRRRLQPGTQFDYEWRIRHDISKIAAFDARELLRDPQHPS